MMHSFPSPAFDIFESSAGVVIPALVIPEDRSIGVCHPCELGNGIGQRTELAFTLAQLFCTFCDPLLQFAVESFELLGLAIKFSKYGDLSAQEFWDYWHRNVIHGAALVTFEPVNVT